MTAPSFSVVPIGVIRKTGSETSIEINPAYREALTGLGGFSHIQVLFWFHQNDTPEQRRVLTVHPRKDPRNPLTGVFATHSPLRPNLIGLTRCRILSVSETVIRIADIDAMDGSPVIDIKCYIPSTEGDRGVRVPDWV